MNECERGYFCRIILLTSLRTCCCCLWHNLARKQLFFRGSRRSTLVRESSVSGGVKMGGGLTFFSLSLGQSPPPLPLPSFSFGGRSKKKVRERGGRMSYLATEERKSKQVRSMIGTRKKNIVCLVWLRRNSCKCEHYCLQRLTSKLHSKVKASKMKTLSINKNALHPVPFYFLLFWQRPYLPPKIKASPRKKERISRSLLMSPAFPFPQKTISSLRTTISPHLPPSRRAHYSPR